MNSCCVSEPLQSENSEGICPDCGQKGKAISLLTLKSQLKPQAMRQITEGDYFFCKNSVCEMVYFNAWSHFKTTALRDKVFQKNADSDCYVCYCFGFTRDALSKSTAKEAERIAEQISAWTAEKKCACELKNPQGSCCLGNIRSLI